MLLLQRDREPVDDTPQNLQQLPYSVVPLRLVNEPVKDVADGLSDEASVGHEFAVNAVQDCLEVVAFTRILRVEQLHQLQAELLVHVLLSDLRVNLGRHDEAQEELVSDLQEKKSEKRGTRACVSACASASEGVQQEHLCKCRVGSVATET